MFYSLKTTLIIVLILLSAMSELVASDAQTKSLSVVGKAKVITPISISNTGGQGLDFGLIAIGTIESKIIVAPAPTVPANVFSGDAVVISSTPQKAAKFTVSGQSGQEYNVSLPVSLTLTSGANALTVTNFTCSDGATGRNIGVNDLFYIGAELTVPASAAPLSYHGTFSVTVAYN